MIPSEISWTLPRKSTVTSVVACPSSGSVLAKTLRATTTRIARALKAAIANPR